MWLCQDLCIDSSIQDICVYKGCRYLISDIIEMMLDHG